ncbi:MAG: glycosyltransferase family 4 protein [Candidatus Binatus sp.]|jgi:glycosyltransferase involved in cell wall biosynthesis|uniref:glycosyltransferase family 4 protein n=1 Tax=Candidatus Binatus sp. TaxID=2811406 RepID=UPI003D0E166F
MKTLHLPFCFYPDPVGGTEIYVESLATCLRKLNVEAEIAVPAPDQRSYRYNDLTVHRFATGTPSLADLYGLGDPVAAQSFAKVLESCAPDVVHLHSWTAGVSIRVLRIAKAAGIPVVFTYHTPTVSCVRGTLLRWGIEQCDGDLESSPCAACMLHGKGLSRPLSIALASLPVAIGERIGKLGLEGRLMTAVRASELIHLRKDALTGLFDEADALVAVCNWVYDLMLRNGVDKSKLTISHHALRNSPQLNYPGEPRRAGDDIRIAFLGRLAREKGIDILLAAMRRISSPRLKLDIFGIANDSEAQSVKQTVVDAADQRIRLLPPFANVNAISELRGYDCLAVPSQWLETGPLVVLEAFAAGIPVIGSNLGGIAELVEHEKNGLLVEPASIEAWVAALNRLLTEPGLLPRLRLGIPKSRTMEQVAGEMLTVYRKLAPTVAPLASLENRPQ